LFRYYIVPLALDNLLDTYILFFYHGHKGAEQAQKHHTTPATGKPKQPPTQPSHDTHPHNTVYIFDNSGMLVQRCGFLSYEL
jgi:hypothetical protein